MRTMGSIWLLLLAFVVSAGVAQAQVRVGDVPPDSLGKDGEGNEVRVSDHRGKVVVLTFWATWCGYCLKELPILENVQRRVGKSRIEVVAINTDEDRADYVAMRRRLKGFQLTMTADERRGPIARQYGVSGLPHMVMIGKSGRIAYVHIGYAERMLPTLVDEINALLEAPTPKSAHADGAAGDGGEIRAATAP